MKKVAFYTLGCKVNQYETEAMLELFEKEGYEKAETEDYADVYVINTCTVTHMSDRKSRQYIRRMKKKNPDAIIAVVGCYSQVSPEEILSIDEVNLVMGTNDRKKIVEEVKKIDASRKVSTVDDIMKVKAFEEIEINKTNGKTRAFMKIQDGCDRYCSYCIIPYARGGKVRSRDMESIVNEAKTLAENGYKEVENLASNGYKEVVLTGIHVASYGKDIKDSDIKLLDVIKQINDIEGIERIRLSSVEPILFTDEFVEAVSTMDKVCPHYHLSLQSGCDETLKRMNRRYTTAPPTNAPANCATIYPGTMLHAKLPSAASAMVNAGLKLAPDAAPKIKAGTSTARPQASVIWTAPAPFMPDLFRLTLATTPSPNRMRIMVPTNSAIYGVIINTPS